MILPSPEPTSPRPTSPRPTSPRPTSPRPDASEHGPGEHVSPEDVHDVVIVGAGPAGLGVAATLGHLDVRALVVDRHEVGASFRRWPEGMRLITPSFPGNQFGAVDLNAITPDTSPALSLVDEHPTGEAYARYLDLVVDLEQLDVRTGIEVTDVRPHPSGPQADLLAVHVADGEPLWARAVVWAAGERQYPATSGFPGAERCTPTVEVRRWDDHPGQEVVVIGGYESGIDAAINLVDRGRRVTVVDRDAPWEVVDADPSRTLSPYTHGRLQAAHGTGRLTLLADAAVTEVSEVATPDGCGFQVHLSSGVPSSDDPGADDPGADDPGALDPDADTPGADRGAPKALHSDGPPLLAIGFRGSLTVVADRFAFDGGGRVVLTETADESTVVPGLYLAGPMLAHREAIFCFIYKFRQRFAIVAAGIAERLGVDPSPLKSLREHGFYLDDLSCCDDACDC